MQPGQAKGPTNVTDESTAEPDVFVRGIDTGGAAVMSWGAVRWLVDGRQMPGAEQTLGVVEILPGQRNPLHRHPTCEELLYVLSGECEHKLGDDSFQLSPGMVIRIPRGVAHWARCTSEEPLVAVISFSSPDRETENLDDDGEIA
jgi:quercetin dioxygenase-like cupin family protein